MTQNNLGPYYVTAGQQGGKVNNPVNENVEQTDPAPPPCNTNYDATSTEIFWLTQQGILVPTSPKFLSYASATFYVNKLNSFIVVATGNPVPVIFSSGLPAGLTLTNNGNGQATLSGTPLAIGTFLINFTAVNTDAFGPSTTQQFTLTVQQLS